MGQLITRVMSYKGDTDKSTQFYRAAFVNILLTSEVYEPGYLDHKRDAIIVAISCFIGFFTVTLLIHAILLLVQSRNQSRLNRRQHDFLQRMQRDGYDDPELDDLLAATAPDTVSLWRQSAVTNPNHPANRPPPAYGTPRSEAGVQTHVTGVRITNRDAVTFNRRATTQTDPNDNPAEPPLYHACRTYILTFRPYYSNVSKFNQCIQASERPKMPKMHSNQ